jgi:hypothetical protein
VKEADSFCVEICCQASSGNLCNNSSVFAASERSSIYSSCRENWCHFKAVESSANDSRNVLCAGVLSR